MLKKLAMTLILGACLSAAPSLAADGPFPAAAKPCGGTAKASAIDVALSQIYAPLNASDSTASDQGCCIDLFLACQSWCGGGWYVKTFTCDLDTCDEYCTTCDYVCDCW